MQKTITTGHVENIAAHSPADERMCEVCADKIGDTAKGGALLEMSNQVHREKYHFCSTHYTDHSDSLKYVGFGKIVSIKGNPVTETLPVELLHFWAMKKVELPVTSYL